jgi:hypothetical protein
MYTYTITGPRRRPLTLDERGLTDPEAPVNSPTAATALPPKGALPREVFVVSGMFIAGGLAASVVGALQVYNALDLTARVASRDLLQPNLFHEPLHWLVVGTVLLTSGIGLRIRSVSTYALAIGAAAGVGGAGLVLARIAWGVARSAGLGSYVTAAALAPASVLLLMASAYSLAALARHAPWYTSAKGKFDVAPARAVLAVLAIAAAAALAIGVLIAQGRRDFAEDANAGVPGAECEQSGEAGFACESP